MANIEQRLNDKLKAAMRARDKRAVNLVRMLKAKMTEEKTAKGFSGEVDDALWQKVIEKYAKSQRKAIEQYQQGGEAGQAHIEEIEYELRELEPFLPKKADEATVRRWVDEAIEGMGGKERAKVGPVMGVVMKAHKGEADPAVVRSVVEEALK